MQQTSKFHRRTQATMAKRTTKIVPVGAWVELGPTCVDGRHEAIISAQTEEERSLERQRQKQAKLDRFQRDVRHRVQRLQQQKQKQQLQKSCQAVEMERRIIQQSSHAAEGATTKKNYCLYRNTDLSIKASEGAILLSDAESEQEEPNTTEHLRDQSHHIYRMVKSAKRNLAAKQLIQEKRTVPGGTWGESFTRDKQDQTSIPQQPIDDIGSYGDSEESDQMRRRLHTTESVLYTGGMSPPKTLTINPHIGQGQKTSQPKEGVSNERAKVVTFDPSIERLKTVTVQSNIGAIHTQNMHKGDHERYDSESSKAVTFDSSGDKSDAVTFDPSGDKSGAITSDPSGERSRAVTFEPSGNRSNVGIFDPTRKSSKAVTFDPSGDRPASTRHRKETCPKEKTVLDLMPGVEKEEHKRQIQNQYSMYRRLFMDIEREQVRENIRKKEHHKKINRLKKQKEQERQAVESRVFKAMEVRHPLTGETDMETQQRETNEEQYVEEMVKKEKHKQQKHKETQRYIRALRAMMKEKMSSQGVEPPPLCACSATIWECNPDMCANNCVFYKNPKAFAKALSSLLMSCHID